MSQTPLLATDLPAESGSSYPAPFASRMGPGHWHALGDAFGLTQFGVNLETLEAGSQSSLRHTHTHADELIYMLSGELVLRTHDGEFILTAGMCMGFKAGDGNAHHMVNRSPRPASFIVIGSRIADDLPLYPDDDLMRSITPTGRVWARKDATVY